MLRSVLPAATRVDFAHAGLADLDTRIGDFSLGKTHVLVATTVLETGIDIANLNTIIIHEAVCLAETRSPATHLRSTN